MLVNIPVLNFYGLLVGKDTTAESFVHYKRMKKQAISDNYTFLFSTTLLFFTNLKLTISEINKPNINVPVKV